MNAVKVVGGLVEIGAAFKFLNTAELAYVTPENAWFDAQVVLPPGSCSRRSAGSTCWALPHRPRPRRGQGRPRPAGRRDAVPGPGPLPGPRPVRPPAAEPGLGSLVVGILPPDAAELNAAGPAAPVAGAGPSRRDEGHLDRPETGRARGEELPRRRLGHEPTRPARERAKAENKPVLIDFTGVNCANCRLMEQSVLPRPEVVERLTQVRDGPALHRPRPDRLDHRGPARGTGREEPGAAPRLVEEATNPFYVALAPDGKVLATIAFSPARIRQVPRRRAGQIRRGE